MNREVCNHGLLIGSQCDLCMRESREGKPTYTFDAPATATSPSVAAANAGVDEGMRERVYLAVRAKILAGEPHDAADAAIAAIMVTHEIRGRGK